MFRDSHGVVHTVSSADPLADVPAGAAAALARALLVPGEGDLGSTLERCEAVTVLLDRWQDAFFAALPSDVDLEEERRYAAAAGVSLEELEDLGEVDWDDEHDPTAGADDGQDEVEGQLDLDVIDLDDDEVVLGHAADPATAQLEEEFVGQLERELLLLPMRVRLEALLGASALVEGWAELLADHEKLLGHLVLAHGQQPVAGEHQPLVDLHATLHAGTAGHP